MAMIKRFNSKEDFQEVKLNQNQSNQTELGCNVEWAELKTITNLVNKRAHHASFILDNQIYIFGGYQSGGAGLLSDFLAFNLQTNQWTKIFDFNPSIGSRHSHSLVAWKQKLLLFGGIYNTFQSTNKVLSCQTNNKQVWKQQKCNGQLPPPMNSHRCIVYDNQMLVFGGQLADKYNQHVYSLNLLTNEWKIVCDLEKHGVQPRADVSISLYNGKVYMFGGKKDDVKFKQLWEYNIAGYTFTKIQPSKSLKPFARNGHSSCIFKNFLIIFGGTTGVTHQKNDLMIYDICKNCWHPYWSDQQESSEENNKPNSVVNEKKLIFNRSDSICNKSETSSFNPCNNMCVSQFNNDRTMSDNDKFKTTKASGVEKQKYRQQMKSQNYYNQNYPFYGDRESLLGNKHRKNDLLIDLEKQTKEDFKHYHGLNAKNGKKIAIHLSQTFQSLNNSVLTSLPANYSKVEAVNKLQTNINALNEETPFKKVNIKKPKPRDGHISQIYGNEMIIFGGDRHHMSYNDIIMIHLESVLNNLRLSQ